MRNIEVEPRPRNAEKTVHMLLLPMESLFDPFQPYLSNVSDIFCVIKSSSGHRCWEKLEDATMQSSDLCTRQVLSRSSTD